MHRLARFAIATSFVLFSFAARAETTVPDTGTSDADTAVDDSSIAPDSSVGTDTSTPADTTPSPDTTTPTDTATATDTTPPSDTTSPPADTTVTAADTGTVVVKDSQLDTGGTGCKCSLAPSTLDAGAVALAIGALSLTLLRRRRR